MYINKIKLKLEGQVVITLINIRAEVILHVVHVFSLQVVLFVFILQTPVSILRFGDRASYINKYRYQLDAANDLLVFNKISTCFGHVYAHLQEFELPLHCLLFLITTTPNHPSPQNEPYYTLRLPRNMSQ
jgi:hypothetical protein